MVRLIHISDFHLESEISTPKKNKIIESLAEDLKKHVNNDTILLFTGDLIDKGGIGFKDSELCFLSFEDIFINTILKSNPSLKNKIFIISGNHDVYRSKIDEIIETGIKGNLINTHNLDKFISSNREGSIYLKRLENYKDWEKTFYKDYPNSQLSNFENSFKLNIDNRSIGISCLNSSWLCKNEDDKGNILLGKNQIENSLVFLNECDFKIALIHHPLEFFKEFDFVDIKPLIYKNYDTLLTGHVHKLDSEYAQNLNGRIFISVANSTIADAPKESLYVNGYTIIDFNNHSNIQVEYRKYIEVHEKFVPNTDIGTEDGKKIFEILKDDKLADYYRKIDLVQAIENRVVESLNDHIIMSNNNTSVKCSIENIFVEPRILNNPKDSFKKEETKSYTIDSILNDNSNYLIYGSRESGKTLLIDKIFIEAISKFSSSDCLPILLKFADIKNKDLKRIFREFFSISASEIESFLNTNKIVLLIDDISFKSEHNQLIFILKEFVKKYRNIRIIGTSTHTLDNTVPTEYLTHNEIFNFNLCFIQDFTSKEIKLLISKWFEGKDVDMQGNMEKLLKSFTDFKLPKTPLSVTLFLWIFERQEKKPINNSVLVELFIENILEKTNIENIYSDTFDFTNKKRLLSYIARFMKDNGDSDLSYNIEYADLLKFITTYLKNKFSGKPEKILEDFIKRGIFSYEDDDTKLRFKTAFMFHFFLALQFDYDLKFKQIVLSNDNYLNYTEEIEYYTGLKRDCLDILLFTQEKLNVAFSDFNDDIRENYVKIDSVLESKKEKSLTFHIDEKRSKTKFDEKKLDQIFDRTLSRTPIEKDIPKKSNDNFTASQNNLETKKNIDTILKLASVVLKNSEDIDDFEVKLQSYKNILESSISFLMQYRDSLITFYLKHKKEPDFFPKNIDFNLFITVLPVMHQNVMHKWMGSQKMRPVIEDKIKNDILTLNISEYEKFMSVFLYGDIKGNNYPEIIKVFVKKSSYNYIKDLSFLKIMSYYHLRKNSPQVDELYLKLMAEIKMKLGKLKSKNKGEFIKQIVENKKGKLK
ncbi:putative MPP superfamily phosphohydrolase [Flavobacterium sp. CG_23.5]|uniref:metallophosphoesterase n=1 Tax=Flavobacterium sp. CG_23.5 TaxID=2760708 RepID=UPI001AEB5E96|nr:metallophosphoesterase [Flavobacterium sp. CG_23.5]MBP2284812.1 putative MPP superfamily phosphohydrolase [Flavobacterium sp. CG_23.5]